MQNLPLSSCLSSNALVVVVLFGRFCCINLFQKGENRPLNMANLTTYTVDRYRYTNVGTQRGRINPLSLCIDAVVSALEGVLVSFCLANNHALHTCIFHKRHLAWFICHNSVSQTGWNHPSEFDPVWTCSRARLRFLARFFYSPCDQLQLLRITRHVAAFLTVHPPSSASFRRMTTGLSGLPSMTPSPKTDWWAATNQYAARCPSWQRNCVNATPLPAQVSLLWISHFFPLLIPSRCWKSVFEVSLTSHLIPFVSYFCFSLKATVRAAAPCSQCWRKGWAWQHVFWVIFRWHVMFMSFTGAQASTVSLRIAEELQ